MNVVRIFDDISVHLSNPRIPIPRTSIDIAEHSTSHPSASSPFTRTNTTEEQLHSGKDNSWFQ